MEGLAATADHAARGKLDGVGRGYWRDAYVESFARNTFDMPSSPLINRGQYARVAAIATACEQFLAAAPAATAQIISLGAGYDTCFWQLKAGGAVPRLYIEIDQENVVRQKCSLVRAKPALRDALPEGMQCVTPSGISSACGYRLAAVDLNDIAALESTLSASGWVPTEPTLVIAECVLVYLLPKNSEALLTFFGRARCPRAVLVAYEMVHPNDAFGRTMMDNLGRRGCPLLGLPAVPDCRAQEGRCTSCGWQRAEALEMLAFFEQVVAPEERARVCKIELLDELEEWRMLLNHYCVTLAVTDEGDTPMFADVALRKPLKRPPLDAILSSPASPPTATRTSSAGPPLNDTFDEADEAAVWSDEEPEAMAEDESVPTSAIAAASIS